MFFFVIKCVLGVQLEGKTLKVCVARPSSDAIRHANLYITYLEPHVTEAELQECFGKYGTIIETRVLYGASLRILHVLIVIRSCHTAGTRSCICTVQHT